MAEEKDRRAPAEAAEEDNIASAGEEAVKTDSMTDEESGQRQAETNPKADALADVEDTAGEEEAEEDGSAQEKQSFFGRKKDRKDKKDEQIEELNDRLMRQMAEFDNFRKRTEKEKSSMFEVGAKSVIEKILPVVDNFERGMATLSEEEKEEPFAQGMEKVYRQFMDSLAELGVAAIEAQGQPFDPDLHHAVMHVEDENLGENVVAQELQKGYTYHDSVVRHSMVTVAN